MSKFNSSCFLITVFRDSWKVSVTTENELPFIFLTFSFGAVAHRFAGRFGVYITSLNGVYSSFRDLTLWLIPPAEQIEREENMEDGREGVEEMFNFSFYGQ